MADTYGKNIDASLNKGKNLNASEMKDMVSDKISEKIDDLGETFENMNMNWRSLASGVFVLGAIGAVLLSRRGKGNLFRKVSKSIQHASLSKPVHHQVAKRGRAGKSRAARASH